MIKSFEDAVRVYREKSPKSRTYVNGVKAVRIANNTTLRLEGSDYVIRFHETDIVTYRNGLVTLRSGGWISVTTVERMNEFTPNNIRTSGKDILATRADRDPRIIVWFNGELHTEIRDYSDIVSILY